MKTQVTQQQIDDYRENGFLLIENFLDTDELVFWREAVTEAVEQRGGRKLPGKETKTGEDDGINKGCRLLWKGIRSDVEPMANQ